MNPSEDTRNLVDKYKGLSNEDIIADLDKTRIPLEIAIENLAHDFNIGTIVRNANAFNVSRVHIIGKRKYNRRGAMVTDKYLHIDHFATVDEFVEDARVRGMLIVAVDNNRPESRPLAKTKLHENSILTASRKNFSTNRTKLSISSSLARRVQLTLAALRQSLCMRPCDG